MHKILIARKSHHVLIRGLLLLAVNLDAALTGDFSNE